MIKKINFIWAILLCCFVFCETGLCQSQSEYALIRRPVYHNPLIWKWTSTETWNQWGIQLFINPVSTAQGYIMTPDDALWTAVSFHLDHGWNRLVYQECLDNWIEAVGTRGSGTSQFLWPTSMDAHAPCGYWGGWQYSDFYYIFVADAANNRIAKLSYHWGEQTMDWVGTITGGGLDSPQDLDINNGGTFYPNFDDYLWVLNGHQIKRFTLDGMLRKSYGSYGCDSGEDHFCRPTAVVCGRSPWLPPPYDKYANVDWLYVADDGNHRIALLDKDSDSETITWVKTLPLPASARISDLEVDNMGHVWAVDYDNGRLYKYTMDLYPLCYFGSFGKGENQFYYPVSFSNTGGYRGCGDVFVAEAWTDSSGGQYFAIGTDVLDFEVASSVDYRWHYINYTLVDPSHVTIKIYNQADQLVKTLFGALEYSGACTHVWDGTNDAGQGVLPGDYRIVLIDSSGYGDPETEEPVNVVTKEAWVHDQGSFGTTPSSLAAYQSGPDNVTLEWMYPCRRTPWPAFTIYCDGCLCAVTPRQAGECTYTDSGLIPGRSYIYWVKAWDPTDPWESPPSNADTVTLSAFGPFTPPPELPITNEGSILPPIRYDSDTCDLAIEYTIGHPGHFAEIELLFRNPVKVCGFNFLIKLRNSTHSDPELANFRTTNICQDSILIESDWVDYPVRECFNDTAGTLIRDFNSFTCRGQVGDTTESDCNYLWVQGWADPDNCIEESGSWRPLFKFGVDVSCMCDVEWMRSVILDIPFGYVVDDQGWCRAVQYWPPGELFAWWSVPGDANNDFVVDAADVVFLVNYLFLGTIGPCIPEAGDPDSSCVIDVGDIIKLNNYLYYGAAPPKRGCACPDQKEENKTSIFSK